MSAGKSLPLGQHVAGLAFAALAGACPVLFWVYGLPALDGTLLEDLGSIIGVVAAFALLTLAEKVAGSVGGG